ncbi:MAG: ABC transporter permease [Candidatus Eremiobacteraeota bacterium]|nr:ABC transporter permease [Candidatus Eremiobacteraeota bacterium]
MREHGAPANRLAVLGTQAALTLAFLGLWQAGAHAGIVDKFYFSSPAEIGATIAKWCRQGYVVNDVLVTMKETLLGLVIGAVAGVVLGIVLASNRFLGAVFEPLLVLLNSIPRVTLVPLFILWFGLTSVTSKVMSAVALVLFVVFFATYAGIKDVDQALVANARVLGASRLDVARHVLIPSALTWIFASLRSAVGFSLIGAVVAEYLGANAGVGYRIQYSEANLNTGGVFAGLVILMVLVTLVDLCIRWVQRRLILWKPAP